MRTILSSLAVCFLLCSCKDTWPEEYKEEYHKTCFDNAVSWAGSEANAKTYCDCVVEKTVEKYPNVDDLLEHMHEVSSDPDIQKCRELVVPKP